MFPWYILAKMFSVRYLLFWLIVSFEEKKAFNFIMTHFLIIDPVSWMTIEKSPKFSLYPEVHTLLFPLEFSELYI